MRGLVPFKRQGDAELEVCVCASEAISIVI